MRNIIAALTPAMTGAMTQEARISARPDHPQFIPSVPRTATPTPMTDPTIVCVEEVGRPTFVAIVSHVYTFS